MVRFLVRSIFVFYFCVSTVVAIHDLSRQAVMIFGGEGEFYPYTITYRLLNIILSFYICHVCVKQNDDVIVYRGMI